jgi:hypothetical protein
MSNVVVEDTVSPTEATQESTTDVMTETSTEALAEEYQVPDKFAGKSTEDIINSYQNLEREMGRKSQEVGELRKLSDSFLQAEVARQSTPLQENSSDTYEEQGTDFYDDPAKAVNSAIENHPKFQQFQQFQQEQAQSAAKVQLEQTHPDFGDVVKDTKFQDWVKGSPIRMQMFQAADSYNYDAANELLSTWKDRSMVSKTQEVKQQQATNRESQLIAATTESRSASGSAGGKTFRRADLIRMKMEDPLKYESLQDVIYDAYASGRVT